ncbi:amidase signature domain-containing protein, partial [Xylariales sp. PMI_506]
MSTAWQDVVARKRKAQAEAIASYQASNSDISVNTTLVDQPQTDGLVKTLLSGEVSAEAVARAYIARAIEAHQKTNCLTEVLFQTAVEDAQALDSALSQPGYAAGPLHGVPMTLKDQFDVKDFDSTIGYVGRALQPASEDAAIVKMLRSLG